MKKIRILLLCLAAVAVAMGFMGCGSNVTYAWETFSGTVKVKIINNADISLTITGIKESSSIPASNSHPIIGTNGTEATIPVTENREFSIPCSVQGSHASAESTKIECYCTSGASVVYPYMGSISGTNISHGNDKTNTNFFSHSSLELKKENPDTITVIYNFVKTTSGDYVLAKVQ